MPVALANHLSLQILKETKKALFTWQELAFIGLCGALPDLLNPHLYLVERQTSWSHSLWGMGIWMMLCLALLAVSKKKPFVTFFMLAYPLHLFCDVISGGIPFLYPSAEMYGGEWVMGPINWVIIDIGLFLWLYGQSWYKRYRLETEKSKK